MSAKAQKWGIVVIAERTANQERQINTLQELQPQRNIQSAGATLTEDARLELNNKWAWAIHENFLDIAERVQCIIEGRVLHFSAKEINDRSFNQNCFFINEHSWKNRS